MQQFWGSTLGPECQANPNPSSTYLLCDLGCVRAPLWASVSSPVKWAHDSARESSGFLFRVKGQDVQQCSPWCQPSMLLLLPLSRCASLIRARGREMPPGPGGTGTVSVTLDSLGPVTPGPPARLTVSSCRGGRGARLELLRIALSASGHPAPP